MRIRDSVNYMMMVMLCLNAASLILSHPDMGITSSQYNPWNQTQMNEALNATELVDSWDWTDEGMFGDVIAGLRFFWNIGGAFIDGFPALLSAMEVPSLIVDPLEIIWKFMMVIWVVSFISGREI